MSAFLRAESLRLSHNKIQGLDISIFKFNHDLEYLDLSHNQLQKISCHPITTSLKHLDLSFNVTSMPCPSVGIWQLDPAEFLRIKCYKVRTIRSTTCCLTCT